MSFNNKTIAEVNAMSAKKMSAANKKTLWQFLFIVFFCAGFAGCVVLAANQRSADRIDASRKEMIGRCVMEPGRTYENCKTGIF